MGGWQARNREADRREAELKAQQQVLEEREALLLGREKFLQDGKVKHLSVGGTVGRGGRTRQKGQGREKWI